MALVLSSVIAFVSWTNAHTPQAALAQYSAPVIDYLPPTDAAVITVRAVVGPGDVVSGSAAETPGHVTVSVQATSSQRGPGTGVGTLVEVVIPLRQPLGDRTVIDAHGGRPLRQH